jgi:hypothetical protein
MLEIIKPGLETSIQDFPGRIGYWNQGFPPSGPMDNWSFRLANILVGNDAGAPGLEAQFMGPTIKFKRDGVIALTGANMMSKLDGEEIPNWQSISVKAGQTLVMGPALKGSRGYLAVAGGIDAPDWLGAASTFHKASVGGLDGNAIKAGQVLPVKAGQGQAGRKVKEACRPQFAKNKKWQIEAVAGPNDDWIDAAGRTGRSSRRRPTSRRRMASFPPISSIRAIHSAPSTCAARSPSSWSMTGRPWAASSAPTRYPRRRSGSSARSNPTNFCALAASASRKRRPCALP